MNKNKPDWISAILFLLLIGIFIIGIRYILKQDKNKPIIYKFEPMWIQTKIYTCSDTITLNDTILIK